MPSGSAVAKNYYKLSKKYCIKTITRACPTQETKTTTSQDRRLRRCIGSRFSTRIEVLAEKQIQFVFFHCPYSPDLIVPCHFVFSKLKETLKGKHYDTTRKTFEKTLSELRNTLTIVVEKCFEGWKKRCYLFHHVKITSEG